MAPAFVVADSLEEARLLAEIARLESALAEARARLADTRVAPVEQPTVAVSPAETSPALADPFGGRLRIGGAVRVNYTIGSYGAASGTPSRAWSDGGSIALDTFRINAAWDDDPVSARFEYRFFEGYHFLHTAWVGYEFADGSSLRGGVHRVPFGPGPYGVSQSWFFDQHYYLGLADDMDLGFVYSRSVGDWVVDLAFFLRDEGSFAGSSRRSARYSYDVVNESGAGYVERNQVNLRAIHPREHAWGTTDTGLSLQYGRLHSRGPQRDGSHHAVSAHVVHAVAGWRVAAQLTRFSHDVASDQPLGTDALVQFGAYDFPNTVAAKGWLPALSVSYTYATEGIPWLDAVTPYAEYSRVMKRARGFNDSALFILGAAWAKGGWYIYTDLAISDGNEFVGGEAAFGDRLGANPDNRWQQRVNVNFGYYY